MKKKRTIVAVLAMVLTLGQQAGRMQYKIKRDCVCRCRMGQCEIP